MKLTAAIAVTVLTATAGGACKGPAGPETLPAATVDAAGSRVAIMMLAVATGRQGKSFLDNFLPCTRRGVANYFNTGGGRHVTFSGCDLGRGIVIDGSGGIDWTTEGPRERFCALGSPSVCESAFTWQGDLTVTIDGQRIGVTRLAVTNLVMAAGGTRFPDFTRIDTGDLGFVSLALDFQGATVSVDDPSLPEDVFDAATPETNPLPNPGNSLASLTEADLKRVAYHAAVELAAFLIDETTETQRGDHTHDGPCGTSVVTVDPVLRLPTITASWQRCAAGGLLFSGSFAVQWVDFGDPDRLQMVVDGTFALEGGIPAITVDRFTWILSFPTGFPGTATISGTLESDTGRRDYRFDLTLDD